MTKNVIIKKIFVFSFLFIIALANVKLALAQDTLKNLNTTANKAYTGSETGNISGSVGQSLPVLIGKIIGTGLSFLGVIFLILMIYGGFLWMLDRGEGSHAKKAKELIEAAIIGLIIVTSAYVITSWLGGKLTTNV